MYQLNPAPPRSIARRPLTLGRPGVPLATYSMPHVVRGPQAPIQRQAQQAQQGAQLPATPATKDLVAGILQAGRADDGAGVRNFAARVPMADLRLIAPWATRWWAPWAAYALVGIGGAIVPGTIPGVFFLKEFGPLAGAAVALWLLWGKINQIKLAIETGRYIKTYAPELFAAATEPTA